MSYCIKCGKELKGNERFCGACGTPVGAKLDTKVVQEEKKATSKKKWGIIIGVALIVIAIIVGVIIAFGPSKEEKAFNEYMAMAEKYVEDLDYEQAEAAYLEAIKIDKKQLKPYVELAKIYIEEERYDDAQKVVDDAKKNGATGDDDTQEGLNDVVNVLDEHYKSVEYNWVVEADIEVDEIYYLPYSPSSMDASMNQQKKQQYSEYAVIRQGDLLGMIDMEGEVVVPCEYKSVTPLGSAVILEKAEPVYIDKYDMEWTTFIFENGKIEPIDGLGGPGFSLYYYCDGLYVDWDWSGTMMTNLPNEAFPVQETSILISAEESSYDRWKEELDSSKYAVYYKNKLVTDFIYDYCGSVSDGLLAASQDGKWGYVDQNGKVVIPIEYDSSWAKGEQYYEYDEDYNAITHYNATCYGASDGYVTLRKGDEWMLCNLEGEILIPAGTFEEILPVYKGKCWVKQDGKWGVIEFVVDEASEEKGDEVTTDMLSGVWLQEGVTEPVVLHLDKSGNLEYGWTGEEAEDCYATYSLENGILCIAYENKVDSGETELYYTLKFEEEELIRKLTLVPSEKNKDVDTQSMIGWDQLMIGTYVQIKEEAVAKALDVPESAEVVYDYKEPGWHGKYQYYECVIIVLENGESVASAGFDAYTGEVARKAYPYGTLSN